jgi:ribosomal-protein-alanine N-acetyltransferase
MVAAKTSWGSLQWLGHISIVSASVRSQRGPRMILRGYDPADLDAMHALDVACFERPFRFSRVAMRRFAEAKKARVVIAEIDDEVVGFCIVHIEQAEHGRAAYIVTLDVAPEQRRKGIARSLMLQAEMLSADAGCTMMALHVFTGNTDAIRFYEGVGFLRSHRADGFYGDGLDALTYHKVLAVNPANAIR